MYIPHPGFIGVTAASVHSTVDHVEVGTEHRASTTTYGTVYIAKERGGREGGGREGGGRGRGSAVLLLVIICCYKKHTLYEH